MKHKRTDFIVVHCAATDMEWHGETTAADIDRWHKDRGWSGIGYHFYIRHSGVLETGRKLHERGAHVKGWNHASIGICLEGGVKITRPPGTEDVIITPAINFGYKQMLTLEALLTTLKTLWPKAMIQGHRDFMGVTKTCPNFNVGHFVATGKVIP